MVAATKPRAPDYPSALGFNAFRFPKWRQYQREAIDWVLDWLNNPNAPRVMMLEAPPGTGKSLVAGGVVQVMRQLNPTFRAVVTTQTLSLQRQYVYETLVDMAAPAWGRSNHECLITDTTVDAAPCAHGYQCPVRSDCGYYAQRDAAERAGIAVLNTSYFLHSANYAKLPNTQADLRLNRTMHFDKADLYVHDEGHLLESSVQGFVEERLSRQFFWKLDIELPKSKEYAEWQDFYAEHSGTVKDLALAYEREARRLAVQGKVPDDPLGRQATRQWRTWNRIMEELLPSRPLVEIDRNGVGFRPVWGTQFAKRAVWEKGPKHLLMSATIFHHGFVASTLGLEDDDYAFVSLPSLFAPMRRQIVYDPVVRVNRKTKDAEFARLVDRMDTYLDRHALDKSIVHSVSYERSKQIMAMSRHTGRMLVQPQGRGKREEYVERYLAAPPGAILVSPAVGMGEDFGRGENCRAQFFVKYPIPNFGDPVVRARADDNPDSSWMEADMSFVQALGRGTRSEDDYCTNYVLDAGAGWRFQFLPGYIRESIVNR